MPPLTLLLLLQCENRYIRDISSHRRLAREIPSNSSVLSLSPTLPTPTANHLQNFNSSNQISSNTSRRKTSSAAATAAAASVDPNFGHRIKRQSTGREQLCQTTYQYITPQAALNSQGMKKTFV